jgi:hypothetical protein
MVTYKCYVGCPETAPCVLDWFPSPCICTKAVTLTSEPAVEQTAKTTSTKTPTTK